MVSKETMADGTVRLTGGINSTRMGETTAWYYAQQTNVTATFFDGMPPRVGDLLVCKNGYDLGAIYTVTKVNPDNTCSIGYNNIRNQMFLDTGWIIVGNSGNPAFQNSWINYNLPANHAAAAFRSKNGIIYLKGMIKSGVIGSAAFTLPTGYRPTEIMCFTGLNAAAPSGAASTGTAHTHNVGGIAARVDVNPDGTVVPVIGTSTYVSLAGMSFVQDA